VRPVSVRDNFFELGGHSLSAMRLLGRLQKLFNQDVPLSVFFANPTVEHLTHYLYQKNERLPAYSLVSIQPHGEKPPFFFVHPASGTIFPYVRLASFMQPDQPIYAFEESFISSQWQPCDSVEVMAERYIELLLKFKPQGPYHLGGWSFGGLIAYEIARRLTQRGHEVALLAMIDTFAPLPEYHPPTEDDTSIISWSVLPIVFSWPDHPKGYLPPILPLSKLREMSTDEQWAYITEFAVKINLVDTTEQVQRWINIYKHHVRANQVYKPEGEMYAGKVSLLKMVMPEEIGQPSASSPLGWDQFTTGPVEVFQAEGDHFGLMGAAGPILSHRIEHYINTWVEEQQTSAPES
jgi:thioesterase domain-containing protein/acyl carrier protein